MEYIQAQNMKHNIDFLYNISRCRWQSSYTLLWSRPSARRSKIFKNNKVCSMSSVFSKTNDYYGASDYLTRLTVTLTFSFPVSWAPELMLYVRSTFHYRTALWRVSASALRLFVVHSALLLSSVYSARILEEFHLIHLDLSPTYRFTSPTSILTHYPVASIVFILVALPLLDREVVLRFTIGCLASELLALINVYDFIISTEHMDLLSMLW